MQSTERLRNEQVAQVVAEVTRLAQRREDLQLDSLERSQVEQILQELNLPPDLIDDALVQLRRKEALARERRRKKWIIAAATVALLALLTTAFWWTSHRNAIFARITGDQGRITGRVDSGSNMSTVTRNGEEVNYHVTLRDVPLNERLSLDCKWTSPSGQVFKQNHWETQLTNQTVWPTFCKCQIGAAAEKGTWKVEMSLGGRVLSSTTFQVE
ncbi:MAG TPA: DUF3859 domain-containing protein [Blastocatellia bacterium]|nr:DUF3859 domain-containing protein [Blastocatellia bacterium]